MKTTLSIRKNAKKFSATKMLPTYDKANFVRILTIHYRVQGCSSVVHNSFVLRLYRTGDKSTLDGYMRNRVERGRASERIRRPHEARQNVDL